MPAKKPRKATPPPPAATGVGRAVAAGVVLRSLLAVGIVVAVVAGVSWVGDKAGVRVADRERYQVPVAGIACDPPPGVELAAFLTEVRHLGKLPATVSAVDPATPALLAAAFARHPWVERVDGVTVSPDRTVAAALTFRVPTLAVRVTNDLDVRVVDRAGVLLPPGTPHAGLPVLTPTVQPAAVQPGERWPGEVVPRAAELADQHRDRKLVQVEKLPAAGWRLLPADGRPLRVSF